MKAKAIFLIVLTFVLLFASLITIRTFSCSYEGYTKYGIPAYFVEEGHRTESGYVQERKLNIVNILILHALLGIPIFISGYLWALSKQKNPNQGVDPTL